MEERENNKIAVAEQDGATQQCSGGWRENMASLQSLCGCLKRKRRYSSNSRLLALLRVYFMPRHENDVIAYMKRYKKLIELPQCVEELLNNKRKQSHENV